MHSGYLNSGDLKSTGDPLFTNDCKFVFKNKIKVARNTKAVLVIDWFVCAKYRYLCFFYYKDNVIFMMMQLQSPFLIALCMFCRIGRGLEYCIMEGI